MKSSNEPVLSFVCPHCNRAIQSVVVDSRAGVNARQRKRECELCGGRFFTVEKIIAKA